MNPRNLFAGAVTNRISKDLAGTEFAKVRLLMSLLVEELERACSTFGLCQVYSPAHAIYYDVQIVSMWRYLGQKDVARSYLKLNSMHRLDAHIRRDGRLFRELTKKSSWSSSLFALRGWIILASQAEAVGIDLWHIQPPGWNQPILQKACSYMLSHAALGDSKPSKTWPVTDADLTFKIAPEYLSLFIYAEKAYRVQEKDDPVSRKWQVWMEYVHSIAVSRLSLIDEQLERYRLQSVCREFNSFFSRPNKELIVTNVDRAVTPKKALKSNGRSTPKAIRIHLEGKESGRSDKFAALIDVCDLEILAEVALELGQTPLGVARGRLVHDWIGLPLLRSLAKVQMEAFRLRVSETLRLPTLSDHVLEK
ncbi:hypothetical protein RQP46_004908 [Phenoliferia psychrophenolica]